MILGKKKKQGKLIVIDGTDGAGKETQAKLLVDRLSKDGHLVELIDFPRYGQKSAGEGAHRTCDRM